MRIREIREAKHMNQAQLASATGLTQAFICEIETGRKNPSLNTLKKVAEVLNSTIDELVADCESDDDKTATAV